MFGLGKNILVVDLDNEVLKICYLKLSVFGKKFISNLMAKEITNLPENEIIQIIKKFISQIKVKNAEVITLAPSHLSITKNIEVPSIKPDEIRDIINLQATRHSPYSKEEIIIDYLDIGRFKEKYTKILLVMTNRNIIRKQYSILNKVRFPIKKVVFKPEVIVSTLNKILNKKDEPTAILHIDKRTTDFTVTFKNKVIFTRNISLGYQNLSEGKESFCNKLQIEIEKSFESYQTETIEKLPNSLILIDSTENFYDIDEKLKVFNLPIKIYSYYKYFPISKDALKTIKENSQFSFFDVISTGFVVEKLSVDLVPQEIKDRIAFKERNKDIIQFGLSFISILILICGLLITKIYFRQSYLNQLNAYYQNLNKKTKLLEETFHKIKLCKTYLTKRGYCLNVLDEIYRLIPPDLYLTEIVFDQNGTFSVKGTTYSRNSLYAFANDMEKSEYFKEVKRGDIKEREEEGKIVVDFDITALLEEKQEK